MPPFRSITTTVPTASLERPPTFSGAPDEYAAHFACLVALFLRSTDHTNNSNRDQVLAASTFLRGAALDWFLGLLRKNALAFAEGELQPYHIAFATTTSVPQDQWEYLLVTKDGGIHSLYDCKFVIGELLWLHRFLHELREAFPN